jgi:anti-sigma factor RsiW
MNPELEEKLSALLDGELSPREAEALRGELERSPELRQRMAELDATNQALRALAGPQASSDLRARLQEKIESEAASSTSPAPRSPGPRRARRAFAWMATGAAAAAIVALVMLREPAAVDDEPGVSRMALNPDDAELEDLALALLEPEAGDAALPAATDADLEVIEVLDLLAALDLEATSG